MDTVVQRDFDVIVIGGGASGGTLASEIATAGKRVLLLERGTSASQTSRDEYSTLVAKRPYDDRLIQVNEQRSRLYMGGGPGGGTSVYGAALIRPEASDFHPGQHYEKHLPRHQWDWPVDYSILAPYYHRAEKLYRVALTGEHALVPHTAQTESRRHQPLPLAPINRRVMEKTQRASLQPFQLPLAIDSDRCLRCSHCAGFVCPTGARRSSANLVAEAQTAGYSLTVLSNREVSTLSRADSRISHVNVVNRSNGNAERFSAQRYVMAAGAIGTPCILQRSGFQHPELGRNYMMHYSPIAVGLFARPTAADRTFVKQLGFADFYFGTNDVPEKMGIIQSLPAPGPLMLKKSGLKRIPTWVLNRLRNHMLPLVGIVEDLPNPANRVESTSNGRIVLRHRFSNFDRLRGDAMSRGMQHILRAAGAQMTVTRQLPSAEHVAHQCGTARFGTDPRHAVADPDCRIFGGDDVFIADGSLLPTSMGVGPSLTLIANALRLAEIIQKEV